MPIYIVLLTFQAEMIGNCSQCINKFAHYLTIALLLIPMPLVPQLTGSQLGFTFFPVWQVVAWSGRGMP